MMVRQLLNNVAVSRIWSWSALKALVKISYKFRSKRSLFLREKPWPRLGVQNSIGRVEIFGVEIYLIRQIKYAAMRLTNRRRTVVYESQPRVAEDERKEEDDVQEM